jgi:hypothetical protein
LRIRASSCTRPLRPLLRAPFGALFNARSGVGFRQFVI